MQGLFGSVLSGVSKAINALNIFVQAIGRVIQMFTGKNPLEQFNNSAKEAQDSMNNVADGVGGIGSSADSSKKKVDKLNKSLTKFDDLNILEKKEETSSSGGGGVSSGGNVGNIGDIDLGIDGMTDKATAEIERLAKNIKKFIDSTIKNIERFEPILKGIAAGFLTAFAIVAIVKIIDKIKNLKKNIGQLIKEMTSLQKAGLMVAGLAVIFTTVFEASRKFTNGTATLSDTLLNVIPVIIAVGAAVTALGFSISTAMGVIGIIGTLLTTLIAGISGYYKGLEDVASSNIYGTLELTAEELDNLSQSIGNNLDEQSKAVNTFKDNMTSLNSEFNKSVDSIEKYNLKFGILGQEISGKDVPLIIGSIEQLGKSTTDIIEQSTTNSVSMWSKMFEDTKSVSKTEQKDILQTIFKIGESQKKEVATIQQNITSTYDKAIKARGYLTDEEYNYVSGQLARLREITNVEMMKTQADVEINKRTINDKNLMLDKKSYDALVENITAGEKTASETARNLQNQAYVDAKIMRDNAIKNKIGDEQEAQSRYMSMLRTADEEYRKEMTLVENNTMDMLKGTRDKITSQKEVLIQSMKDGGTALEKEELKQLDALEKGLDERVLTYANTMYNLGKAGTDSFDKSFSLQGPLNRINTFSDTLRNNTNKVLGSLKTSYNSLRANSEGKLDYISFPKISDIVPRLARGAVLNRPTKAIIAEQGPEAVVPLKNNTQWMDIVANGILKGLSGSLPQGTGSVTIPIYLDSELIAKQVINIQNKNQFATNGGC